MADNSLSATVTHEQAREAYKKLHDHVYCSGRIPTLSVPPQPTDVDIVLCNYIEQQAALSVESGEGTSIWLVELFHNDKSEGWWVGPAKSEGGWRTENAWAAKHYTESEAKAVAAALDYFPTPNRWSHWMATEHIFIGDEYSRPVVKPESGEGTQPDVVGDCDCPCEACGVGTGKHCGIPPCDSGREPILNG